MTKKEELREYLFDKGLLKDILFEYLSDSLEWHPDIEQIGVTQDEIIEVLADLESKLSIKIEEEAEELTGDAYNYYMNHREF